MGLTFPTCFYCLESDTGIGGKKVLFLFVWNTESNIHENQARTSVFCHQTSQHQPKQFSSHQRKGIFFSLALIAVSWSFTEKHNNKEGRKKCYPSQHDRRSSLQTKCLVCILQRPRENSCKFRRIQIHAGINYSHLLNIRSTFLNKILHIHNTAF